MMKYNQKCKLKRETSARYKELLDAHTGALGELAASLNTRFHRWAHDNASLSLQWQSQDNAIKVANPALHCRRRSYGAKRAHRNR